MASKKVMGKVEIDIQKLRDEGCWKKLIELTEIGKIGLNGIERNTLLNSYSVILVFSSRPASQLLTWRS